MNILIRAINIIINLFFPPRCSFCSELMDFLSESEHSLCPKCADKIEFIGNDSCEFCGKRLNGEQGCMCRHSLQKIHFSKVYSACEYSGIVREKLLDFKFKGKTELARIFAWFIVKKLKMTNESNFDIIISVPIHEVSMGKRGYNQSELVAKYVAKYFSKSLSSTNLVKIKETLSQSTLDREKRMKNIIDAFEVRFPEKIFGKRILLIDDIFTTGSTANECSRVLINAGAKQILIATVATGKVVLE